MLETIAARFEKKVEKTDGCWLWRGSIINGGYGMMLADGKNELAHRISYRLHKGEIPEGMLVLHKCDVRHCVKPDHLFAGTQVDNMKDMVDKGRHYSAVRPHAVARGARHGTHTKPESVHRGDKHPGALLTAASVLRIRDQVAQGVMHKDLAAEYGVKTRTITAVVSRQTWKHI